MIDTLLQLLAPHPCISCGEIGAILCPNCKYDIVKDFFVFCIICGKDAADGICPRHASPFQSAWTVGIRKTVLQRLVGTYKFNGCRSAVQVLADLLDVCIPSLAPGTIVTCIPTHPRRIRERGYDHMALLARTFALRRSITYVPLLEKTTHYIQHTSNRRDRLRQVRGSFNLLTKPSPEIPVLLLDDVLTTGATLIEAASVISAAGVRSVKVAVIARQPLD